MNQEEITRITSEELRTLEPARLAEPDIIERFRVTATDPTYWSEMGESTDMLALLRERVALVPLQLRTFDFKKVYDEIFAIFGYWTLPNQDSKEAAELYRTYGRVLAGLDIADLEQMMPRIMLSYGRASDAFMHWVDAVADGLRNGTELIGGKEINIFTGDRVRPTIGNWVKDFERFSLNHPGSIPILISSYISKSGNVLSLTEDDRTLLRRVFRWFALLRFGPDVNVSEQRPRQIFLDRQSNNVRPIRSSRVPLSELRASAKDVEPAAPIKDAPEPLPSWPLIEPGSASAQPSLSILQPTLPTTRPTPLTMPQPTKPLPQKQVKATSGPTPELKVRQSLSQGRALIDHYEKAEKILPPLDRASIGQLAVLADEAIKGGDATRAVAGLFQIARVKGITALANDPSFMQIIRQTVGPYLQTIRHISPDLALRAVDLSPNRMLIVKGFFRILLTRAAGNETNAARVMVHITGLVPPNLSGSEITFAYFDLPTEQYRWADTAVDPDGILRNEIN